MNPEVGEALAEVKKTNVEKLPIRLLKSNSKADQDFHEKMTRLVENVIDANKQLRASQSDRDHQHYEHKCAALDRQIDQLVYELYELAPEEIALVEGSAATIQ